MGERGSETCGRSRSRRYCRPENRGSPFGVAIGEDDIWPAIPVRELVETVRSNHVETGIVLGRQNRRGVTSRLPRDGGKQERDLVALYRKYSKSTALEWPRTSAVLERIASAFEEFGRWHDEDAERLDW